MTELFDLEAERLRVEMMEQHMASERQLLGALRRHYMPLAPFQPSREAFSLATLESLKRALGEGEVERIDVLLEEFVSRQKTKLSHIYSNLAQSSDPFLFQPESLLMFMLIDRNSASLAGVWPEHLPRKTPIEFGNLWGVPAHDPDSTD